jgi:hypothetical protein
MKMYKVQNIFLMTTALLFMNVYAAGTSTANQRMEYLDNGIVRIGIDLSIGGAITYFADVRGDGVNMVNSFDWGRQVQMSFYSGPKPYQPNGKKPSEHWKQLGWNPIQSGDCYGNRSKVLEFKNDGKELYVKCIPMHWPLNNVPGNCTFESWIRLDGPAAIVRSRINNQRNDKTQYPARTQELPAVYTNGPWYRLMTYTGNKPFTKDSVSLIPIKEKKKGGFPWSGFQATENWAALVNEAGTGMGVWTPGAQSFLGGFAGKPGKGGPKDNPTGYIAPLHKDILDHNIQYEYDYRLIAGSIEQIRDYVYKHNTGPIVDFDFSADRQHWTHRNASDGGWPMRGYWSVRLARDNPQIIAPAGCWDADKYPVMEITAAFRTTEPTANIKFLSFGNSGKPVSKHVSFKVINNGKMHTYRVNLSENPDYRGAIRKFTLLPCKKGKAGQFVKIRKIRLLK